MAYAFVDHVLALLASLQFDSDPVLPPHEPVGFAWLTVRTASVFSQVHRPHADLGWLWCGVLPRVVEARCAR